MEKKTLLNSIEKIERSIGGDKVIITIDAATWAVFVTEANYKRSSGW